MNLLAVSEKYNLLVIAVDSKLHVYELDPISGCLSDQGQRGPFKVIDLLNQDSSVNNLKLVRCADREFLVTVDMGAHVRMIYLDDLDKDPIKFNNEFGHTTDNSTWSVDGSSSSAYPPRVVVGSNAHSLSIFNLQTGESERLPRAHNHNIPSVSFSPCGRFFASISIDRSVKVWEKVDGKKWQAIRVGIPDRDWGWAV